MAGVIVLLVVALINTVALIYVYRTMKKIGKVGISTTGLLLFSTTCFWLSLIVHIISIVGRKM